MKHTLIVPGLALAALAAAGCARFEIYDDSSMKGPETGFRYYTTKPYLLVVQTKKADKPLEASIVFLPDLSKPQYARTRTGIGSNKLSMNFTNSVLTSFNQETDAKVPEMLTSVGGLVKILSEMKKADTKDAGPAQEVTLYEIDNSGSTPKLIQVK
jgi:hypothetical protein